MIHLGVCYGHNATVAVIKDGKLIFCQSEERLNRIKNSTGFPVETYQYITKNIVAQSDIASVTLFQKSNYGYLHLKSRGFKSFQYGGYLDPVLISKGYDLWGGSALRWAISRYKIRLKENSTALRREAMNYYQAMLALPASKIHMVDHHMSHAYSAIPNVRRWGRSLIFTLDGVGDWTSATVSLLENDKITELDRTSHDHSLGYYYAETTALLGMRAGEHEFKVMGLAPYAKLEHFEPVLKRLRGLITVTDRGNWKSKVTPNKLRKTLEQIYRYQRFDSVAGAIQTLTEELTVKWVRSWMNRTKCSQIALSGGVFMNVKACQRIAEIPEVTRMFIVPSAADESCAVGSAVWGSMFIEPDVEISPLENLYLGLEYSVQAIESALEETRANERFILHRPQNVEMAAAELLADNQVLARCSGKMEFGARALGNRSILANPSRLENLQFINDAIKSRDFWMPFTPSILEEDLGKYIENADRIFAPYMCITFNSTNLARRDLVAAIHPRDFTVRPQAVVRSWNPGYHALISYFKERTGIGALLNTSFNLHGEPNVCTPQDAIRTVDASGLQYLLLGHVILEKR